MANDFIETIPNKTFLELGYDPFGQNRLQFNDAEINQKAQSSFEAGLPSNFILDGELIQRLNVVDGYIQSNNFVSGESGWRIDADGNLEANDGNFRGSVTVQKSDGSFSEYSGGDLKFYDESGNLVIWFES